MDSHVGINPKKWGPHFWKTLFYTALNYPVKIDPKNRCHTVLRKQYKGFYSSLQYTLPCIFCLESYRRFWEESDIDKYLDSRMALLKWLYILKDKVNKKLIHQERQRFDSEKKVLVDKFKKKYGPKASWPKAALLALDVAVNKLHRKILKTQPSISWAQALELLEDMRE